MMILTLLKSPKVIMGVTLAAAIALIGWYVVDLRNDNERLIQSSVIKDGQISNLEASVKGYGLRAEIQEKTIENYLSDLETSRDQNESLSDTLSNTKGALHECINQTLPSEVLDEIFKH